MTSLVLNNFEQLGPVVLTRLRCLECMISTAYILGDGSPLLGEKQLPVDAALVSLYYLPLAYGSDNFSVMIASL